MNALSALGFLSMLGSLSVADPQFPPNAVSGGTVVAELHFVSGNVSSVKILSGEEPFVGSCRTALAKWHVDSERDRDELVIVHFRQPYLYSLGDAKEEVHPAISKGSLPYPSRIIPPSYPANALGQGSVVLRTDISDEGQVSDVKVVEPMGVLTDTSIDAVRRWQFMSAEDERGMRISSHVYAVFVYRFPILSP